MPTADPRLRFVITLMLRVMDAARNERMRPGKDWQRYDSQTERSASYGISATASEVPAWKGTSSKGRRLWGGGWPRTSWIDDMRALTGATAQPCSMAHTRIRHIDDEYWIILRRHGTVAESGAITLTGSGPIPSCGTCPLIKPDASRLYMRLDYICV